MVGQIFRNCKWNKHLNDLESLTGLEVKIFQLFSLFAFFIYLFISHLIELSHQVFFSQDPQKFIESYWVNSFSKRGIKIEI